MAESSVLDGAVRVTATPSQASYFAGDTFTVTITITNTRRPEAPLAARSTSQSATIYGHKRGAHSVSYVPMARPPTSPGVRTALPTVPAHTAGGNKPVVRRGLVGRSQSANGPPNLEEPEDQARRRVNLTKSLSVSLGTQGFQSNGSGDWKGKSPLRTLQTNLPTAAAPNSPRKSSPLARSASVPVNHPHARKQSVLDGQVQVQPLKDSDKVPPDLSAISSTSTLSLALDTITEGYSPVSPATPDVVSPANRHALLTSSASFPPTKKANGASGGMTLTNGHRPPHPGIAPPPRPKTAAVGSFSAPNTEFILYSYAQLLGTVTLFPAQDAPLSAEQRHMWYMLRRELQATKAVGGGNMNIVPNSPKALAHGRKPLPAVNVRRASQHARTTSLSTGLLSLLSPSSPPPMSSPLPGSSRHSRNSSVFSGFFGSSSSNGDIDVPDCASVEEDGDADEPLPTFDVPPAMLAIDLSLMPGQSRNYVYTFPLPRNLPPTYRGRTLRFQYEFVLGICRSTNSRIMRVPVRIYNYVSVTNAPSPYDLRWPVVSRLQRQAYKATVTDVQEPLRIAAQRPANAPNQEDSDLGPYALALLATQDSMASHLPRRSNIGRFPFANGVDDEDQEPGCRESIEILTRNPKRLSFDVHKDNVKVAVLTFTKSAYRLGESVLGVVNLNARAGHARVLKLSAFLESHETLPGCLSSETPSAAAQTRRVHSESHSSFVGSTLRTAFALDIPPDASPAFQVIVSTPGASSPTPGGLTWKVRLCLLVAIAGPEARAGEDGVRLKHLVRDGPRGEWGTAWHAPGSMAPHERPGVLPSPSAPQKSQSWASFFSSTLLGSSEPSMNFHDGDEGSEVGSEDGDALAESEWREVRAEMVECEVPIRVWPGNTAFKAADVVFEV
ncbi:uncharacterized protein PHACADRAFT_110305 [Phanerochaete carnosa HHB-10118-sp]|uniref:Rgp1-domain-containing protein n=1 Tax=Phanerochaete carnosa (strain HHB-10118-sp) TaxID=650164 RepID=K5XCG9_PHACS|nr:uncharacterized protein PHACADRAFT_110305 [Phanerochaete carnosa HHB-10118-sp]EKM60687.1 hypothetical protein PHACADRAFT_110305 [Phanerochaete carnosa HHB-10118-sp]